MSEKIIYLIVGAVTVAILAGILVVGGSTQPETLTANQNASLEVIGESTHNWGQIDINGGDVDHAFQIKNSGETDLEINNIKTSCACTDATVIINGQSSPSFGMHTQSSWKGVIPPGETADIKVVFDPLFHGPNGTGPITRIVTLDTNDSDNQTLELRVNGNVVPTDTK